MKYADRELQPLTRKLLDMPLGLAKDIVIMKAWLVVELSLIAGEYQNFEMRLSAYDISFVSVPSP